MKRITNIYGAIALLILLSSCNVTKPSLGLSGGNYNSITDDMILFNSSNMVIAELAKNISANKILVVQTVNSPSSDMLAEKIYETLFQKGKEVELTKRSDLKSIQTESFDKILFFYPTVYGIETAETRPSNLTKFIGVIPLIGQIIGSAAVKANTYDSRMGAVSLSVRLVDSKTGKIDWIKVFNGKDSKKITGDSIFDITLP